MPQTAKIAVAAAVYAIDRPFDYLIPDHMSQRVQPGVRVAVPFGRGNRLSQKKGPGQKLRSLEIKQKASGVFLGI